MNTPSSTHATISSIETTRTDELSTALALLTHVEGILLSLSHVTSLITTEIGLQAGGFTVTYAYQGEWMGRVLITVNYLYVDLTTETVLERLEETRHGQLLTKTPLEAAHWIVEIARRLSATLTIHDRELVEQQARSRHQEVFAAGSAIPSEEFLA